MISIDPKDISIPQLHGYLLGAVSPRPIAFASTVDAEGRPNLAPFSFFNVFSANPPICIFSPARSGRTNTQKDTFHNVKAHAEVVINIVNYDMVHQMSLASSPYAPGENEFIKAGFTPIASKLVKPFRVKEAPIQLECIVKEVKELGQEGAAGNLVFCEVVQIHISEDVLDENGKIDPIKVDAVGRCGGNWYVRANAESMFEIQKPITTRGIGYDMIPKDIRQSELLSANDLGQLGGIEEIPNETEVNEYKLTELADMFIAYDSDQKGLEKALHLLAKDLLKAHKLKEAWMTLLAFNDL